MEKRKKVQYNGKHQMGFFLYMFGLVLLAIINPKIFFSVGILTLGMLFLIEAYVEEV